MDRRSFVRAGALSVAAGWPLSRWSLLPASALPLPSAPQLAWQRDELAMFLHFGVNTFTDREWGDGKEAPAIFDPTATRRAAVGAHREGRGVPRADPHGEASRRLLPLALGDDAALGRQQSLARRFRRRRSRVRGRVLGRGAPRRALSLPVGSQPSRRTATRRATTTSTPPSSPSSSRGTASWPRCGSTAPTARGRTDAARCTTGHVCSGSFAGCSPRR